MLKVPLSRVSPLLFLIHRARKARGEEALHSVTFSASRCELMIGTSAEWFLRIVTFSLRLYSNRSPRSCALADPSSLSVASSRLTMDPPLLPYSATPAFVDKRAPANVLLSRPEGPLPYDWSTKAPGFAGGGTGDGAGKFSAALSTMVPSCVCGVSNAVSGNSTTGRLV